MEPALPEPGIYIRVQAAQRDSREMKPGNEADASVAVFPDGAWLVTIATQPLQELVKDTQILIEIARSLDPPLPFQEADEPHDSG